MKIDIHDYLDYRTFLRDALALEKSSGRISGQRDVATYLGLKSSGHVSWILQGKRNLMPRLIAQTAKMLGLSTSETRYFRLLVEYNDAENPEERRILMTRLSHEQAAGKRLLAVDKSAYWSSWRHVVLRELVSVKEFRREDAAWIGSRLEPFATASEVCDSMDLLESLDLVVRDEAGIYHRTESILTAGENWSLEAIRSFQESILELSRRALREIAREERDISTVTFCVSPKAFEKIRARIKEMRQEILTLIRTDPDPDRVYHLAIQAFPATRSFGERNG